MVEFCRQCAIPVVAANAPRRYVGAAGRARSSRILGPDAPWPKASRAWLPRTPLPPPSERYLAHLFDDPAVVSAGGDIGVTGEFAPGNHGAAATASGGGGDAPRCPYIGLQSRDGLLEPMLLWDAAMSEAIVAARAADPETLVVHVCGSFHCERRLGIVEMVEAYAARAASPVKQLVVAMYPDDRLSFNRSRHKDQGDYVVLTDAAVDRSHDACAVGV